MTLDIRILKARIITSQILKSRIFGLGTVSAMVLGLAFAVPASAQGGPPPAPTVTVATPHAQRVTNWDEFTGRFEAVEQVEVRPRVSGFIENVQFKDGQLIKKGDPLFTIDQRPYQLAVDVARAEVARAKAQVVLAANEVERAASLTKNLTITQRDLDTRKATLSSNTATQQAAEASLKSAELNLEWTMVRAPISGRISDKRVDAGNLVAGGQAGATLLTTIISLDPIHFAFEVSEADFLRYTRATANGQRASTRDNEASVQVKLSDEAQWSRTGKMNFIDNQLNARSATIRSRAVFDNRDQLLTPGTFGRVRLSGGDFDALLVPDSAIVSDQTRKILFLVGDDNKVAPRPVVIGPMVDGLRVIRSGLAATDRVITVGLANPMVRPGVVVTPQPGQIKPATN